MATDLVTQIKDEVKQLVARNAELQAQVNELQNAITDICRKHPYTFDPEAPQDNLATIGKYIDELQAQVDELQAENDALMAARADDVERLDAMGEGELQKQVDELQAEVEDAQDELKHEWKEAEKWKARCAELRDAVEELKAERDELQARVDDLVADRDKLIEETHRWKAKVDELMDEPNYREAWYREAWLRMRDRRDALSDERDRLKTILEETQKCMRNGNR